MAAQGGMQDDAACNSNHLLADVLRNSVKMTACSERGVGRIRGDRTCTPPDSGLRMKAEKGEEKMNRPCQKQRRHRQSQSGPSIRKKPERCIYHTVAARQAEQETEEPDRVREPGPCHGGSCNGMYSLLPVC